VAESPHEAYLEARHPKAEIRRYAKVDEAVLDLMAERLDLVLAGHAPLRTFLESREAGCCRIVGEAPYDPAVFGEGFGIGIRQEDPELKARFDEALERLAASGEYDRIRTRTFSFPYPFPGAEGGKKPSASR
jgi:polar amino acid transport system substrate-binding protein